MSSDTSIEGHLEHHRARLRAMATRLLGCTADADDALQETWIRATRADSSTIVNPGGWLTTVTARVCLNTLRARRSRPDAAIEEVPDTGEWLDDPSDEAVLTGSVGAALLVVLDRLTPAERVAFVLHDMFAVPFEEIAPVVDRTVEASRQLASRARRRVRRGGPTSIEATPDPDPSRERQLVDAFFAAARRGDLDALVAALDPEAALMADRASADEVVVRGAAAVARRAAMFADPTAVLVPVRVDGRAGVVVEFAGRPVSLMVFAVSDDAVVTIDATTVRTRLDVFVRH